MISSDLLNILFPTSLCHDAFWRLKCGINLHFFISKFSKFLAKIKVATQNDFNKAEQDTQDRSGNGITISPVKTGDF